MASTGGFFFFKYNLWFILDRIEIVIGIESGARDVKRDVNDREAESVVADRKVATKNESLEIRKNLIKKTRKRRSAPKKSDVCACMIACFVNIVAAALWGGRLAWLRFIRQDFQFSHRILF